MLISKKVKEEVKALIIKAIRSKKSNIAAIKQKAYDYVEGKLPAILCFFFKKFIETKIDKIFVEAMSDVKNS